MLAVIGYGYGGGSGWLVLIPVALILMRVFMRRRMGPQGRGGPGAYGGRGSPYGPQSPDGQGPAGRGPTIDAASTPVDRTSAAGPAPGSAEPAVGQVRIPAGWMHDPSGRYDLRYWSGTAWTEHVSRDGVPSTDPPPGARPREEGPDS